MLTYMQKFMHKGNQNTEEGVFRYGNFTKQLSFKTNFQNVDQRTGGK